MKIFFKQLISVLTITLLCVVFAACGPSEEGGDTKNNDITPVLASDYVLPDNFYINIKVDDCAIINAGDPWYYKTAKIDNSWQLIEYDRTLADTTIQETHFFRYISEDEYTWYTYNYDSSDWDMKNDVSFAEMVAVSPNNFRFLYKKPDETYTEITETSCVYDTDPTSAEHNINATLYEYSQYWEIEKTVDSAYPNFLLSSTEYIDNGPLTFRAYEYLTGIDSWSSAPMAYRKFKSAP